MFKRCIGCGNPIPSVDIVDNKYQVCCDKCTCQTKPHEDFEEVVRLWNEGRIIPKSEKAYWEYIEQKNA